jgi:hypothetical protein
MMRERISVGREEQAGEDSREESEGEARRGTTWTRSARVEQLVTMSDLARSSSKTSTRSRAFRASYHTEAVPGDSAHFRLSVACPPLTSGIDPPAPMAPSSLSISLLNVLASFRLKLFLTSRHNVNHLTIFKRSASGDDLGAIESGGNGAREMRGAVCAGCSVGKS